MLDYDILIERGTSSRESFEAIAVNDGFFFISADPSAQMPWVSMYVHAYTITVVRAMGRPRGHNRIWKFPHRRIRYPEHRKSQRVLQFRSSHR